MAANAFHLPSVLSESPKQCHPYCGAYAMTNTIAKEFIPTKTNMWDMQRLLILLIRYALFCCPNCCHQR